MIKEKTYTLQLTEDEIDLLLMGLRYLELHHPEELDRQVTYRAEFSDLLNRISTHMKQSTLFPLEDPIP